jgi:hypothetical protein
MRELLPKNRFSYYNHQFLLEIFLDLAKDLDKAWYLSFFIDIPQWDADQVSLVAEQLREWDSDCGDHPLLCMMAYQYSDIYLGLLSDLRLLQEKFPTQHDHILQLNFPAPEENYPLQWRGLVVNRNSPDLASSLQWSKWYFSLLLDRDIGPRNTDLIAADNETHQRQLFETRFAPLRNIIKR